MYLKDSNRDALRLLLLGFESEAQAFYVYR